MNVKTLTNPMMRLRDLLNKQNGILFTSDLAKYGIPRTYLSILEKSGEIQRVSRGVYSTAGSIVDEMFNLQIRYKSVIFSHETALYLLDLTDRTPLFYSGTVPVGYNATALKAGNIKVFFVKRDLYALGLILLKSPQGNEIKSYNLERTICDIMRSRNQIDVQMINEALKRYVERKERNLDMLYSYARQFRIQKILRNAIEVLL